MLIGRWFFVAALVAGCQGGAEAPSNLAQATSVTNDVSITTSLNGTVLTLQTNEMPKGWYTLRGGFNGGKSPIALTITLPATACSGAVSLAASTADGSFSPVLNPQNKPVGYVWTYGVDLGAYADHWHDLVACDGTKSVVGCPGARAIDVTLTVGGACYDAGGICTSTGSASLPSVQDATVTATGCETCDIGACVSACEAGCEHGDSACRQCCECDCKSTTPGCTPQALCYDGTKGHAACLNGAL